jgi:hypothetical protein
MLLFEGERFGFVIETFISFDLLLESGLVCVVVFFGFCIRGTGDVFLF